MSDTIVIAVISAILGSGVMGFVQFLINRKDDKDDRLKALEKASVKNEKDVTRLQLLVLISLFPTSDQEILTVAKHYFCDLSGNWYTASIFTKWCSENHVEIPNWFNDN